MFVIRERLYAHPVLRIFSSRLKVFHNVPYITLAYKFLLLLYRVSLKSFPDYKHLLQENYVEYKHIFFKCNSTQEVF